MSKLTETRNRIKQKQKNERDLRFRQALASVINQNSCENGSDTPDFILADFMADCLKALDKAIHRRSKWYSHHCTILRCNHGSK